MTKQLHPVDSLTQAIVYKYGAYLDKKQAAEILGVNEKQVGHYLYLKGVLIERLAASLNSKFKISAHDIACIIADNSEKVAPITKK